MKFTDLLALDPDDLLDHYDDLDDAINAIMEALRVIAEMRHGQDGMHYLSQGPWFTQSTPPENSKPRRRDISVTKRRQIMERDRYRCLYCGTWENLTIDHIVPVLKGGTNNIDNLQTLCQSCNSRKGARL